MKKNLFWIVIIIGLVVLIVSLILKDEANWVMAAFTVVLAIATIWNIRVTQGLLRRSETASVINIIDRMIDYVNQNTTALGIDTVCSNTIGRLAAIQEVDKELSGVLWKALVAWGDETKFEEFRKRYEQFFVKKERK